MLILIVVGFLFFTGCDFINPESQKSITEKKQLKAMQEQNKILLQIVVAIEKVVECQ